MTVEAIIGAIRARLPAGHVLFSSHDGLWRAGIVSGSRALERKGSTLEEACTRLLDSVIQLQAEESRILRHG